MKVTTLIHQRRRRMEQVAVALMFERHHPNALVEELLVDVEAHRSFVDELLAQVHVKDDRVDALMGEALRALRGLSPKDVGFADAVESVRAVVGGPLRERDERLSNLLETSLDGVALEDLARSLEVRYVMGPSDRTAA